MAKKANIIVKLAQGGKVSVSRGNLKMDDTLIFNLPSQKTCPGSCGMCRSRCYAKKNERFAVVRKRREDNLAASKRDEFVEVMSSIIGNHFKGQPGFFRIHESGDFYNQEYLHAWFDIANMNTNVKFLAFAKSHMLDFKGCPSNLKIVYSVWEDTTVTLEQFPQSHAGNVKARPGRSRLECPGKCEECRACWFLDATIDVHFNIH